MKVEIWPEVRVGERVPAEFDVSPELLFGDVVTVVDVSVVLLSGADPAPASLKDGDAVIKGGRVFQWLAPSLPCSYRVVCRATTQYGRVVILAGVLTAKTF